MHTQFTGLKKCVDDETKKPETLKKSEVQGQSDALKITLVNLGKTS